MSTIIGPGFLFPRCFIRFQTSANNPSAYNPRCYICFQTNVRNPSARNPTVPQISITSNPPQMITNNNGNNQIANDDVIVSNHDDDEEEVTIIPNSQLSSSSKSTSRLLCKICMANEMCIVLNPCKHLATCDQCIKSVSSCPICSFVISSGTKIYIT